MRKLISLVLILLLGLAVGGGAAFATALLTGPRSSAVHTAHAAAPRAPTFVPAGKILAPLVFSDGRLSGYVSFEFQLEVKDDKVEFVTARLPFLLHAINMRTYRAPMASGPDGMLPNLEVFRKIVQDASSEAFGAGIVRRAAITAAVPV